MQKWFFFIIIISTTFWNCQQPSTANVQTGKAGNKSAVLREPPMSSAPEADFKADSVSSSLADKLEEKSESKQKTPSVISPQNAVRKVIRTADLRFKVAKTDNATYKIETLATHFKGYVTQSQMNSRVLSEKSMEVSNDSMLQITQYELTNNMVVRIPNSQLDTFLTELTRLYIFLDHRTITADDVTLAYMSSQLKSRLREHAAQRIQNATDVKGKRLNDIVDAETAATQLNDEAIEERIANAEKDFNIQYSVVSMTIYQDMDIVKTMKANTSLYAYGPSFFTRLMQAISTGWAAILEIILGLISIWYLFLIGVLAWFFYKKYKK